jgi:uncharacterized protein (TIGR00369 family)
VTTRRAVMPPPPHGGDEPDWIAWAESHPISELIGMRCLAAGPGRVTIRVQESGWPLNPNGAVHGGMVLAWADQCLGLASMTTATPGSMAATATLAAEFLRPAIPPLTYEVEVHRSGRTLIFISIDVFDVAGGLCAKVTGTMAADGNTRFLGTTPEDTDAERAS